VISIKEWREYLFTVQLLFFTVHLVNLKTPYIHKSEASYSFGKACASVTLKRTKVVHLLTVALLRQSRAREASQCHWQWHGEGFIF
jgi:hypothetical protein